MYLCWAVRKTYTSEIKPIRAFLPFTIDVYGITQSFTGDALSEAQLCLSRPQSASLNFQKLALPCHVDLASPRWFNDTAQTTSVIQGGFKSALLLLKDHLGLSHVLWSGILQILLSSVCTLSLRSETNVQFGNWANENLFEIDKRHHLIRPDNALSEARLCLSRA